MNKLLRRLRYMRHAHQMEADLAEEMRFHESMVRAELEKDGVAATDAVFAGKRAMGAATQMREEARGVWLAPWLESIWQDLTYAVRNLRRQPGFAAIAIVALACGIGLNSTLFTVFNAVALRPWSVKEPARVVRVFGVMRNEIKQFDAYTGVSFVEYQYLAGHTKSMSGLFLMRGEGGLRTDVGKLRAQFVTANYFPVLGVKMERGRGFMMAEDQVDAPQPVAVLSYQAWQNRYGSDPQIIGRRVRIGETPFTVVGVTPPDFAGTDPEPTDLWLPMSGMTILFSAKDSFANHFLHNRTDCCGHMGGRLAAGFSREQAATELGLHRAAFYQQFGEKSKGVKITGTAPLQSVGRKAKNFYAVFALMFGGVLLVLLLACANVGNLLLARAAARRREIGVRLSLGAARLRLLRQLLTESLLLAAIASLFGLFIAFLAPQPLFNRIVGEVSFPLTPDGLVLAYTVGITVLACGAFGLAPALHATRGDFSGALKGRPSQAGSRFSLRSLLLSLQVAGSLILLVGAGLMVRGIQRARAVDPGFAVNGIASVSFEFPTTAHVPRIEAFYEGLNSRLATMPAAQPFGLSDIEPLGNVRSFNSIRLPGQNESQQTAILSNNVTPGYLAALHIPLVAGRDLQASDSGRRVLLVNQAMADHFFPHENAVGKTVILDQPFEIVGVMRDAHTMSLDAVDPLICFPMSYGHPPRLILPYNRLNGAALAAIAKELDSGVEMHSVLLSDNLDSWLSSSRMAALIAGLLGAMALALASIGIAGVFAYAVEQRKQEIGIRMALGARSNQVVRAVFASALKALAIGLAVGLAGAVVLSTFLREYIFGLSHLDPITYAAVLLTLAAAGMVATYLPARRATAVDPIAALRQD
jgi:macrolide transport system ATP-binding/permease protein